MMNQDKLPPNRGTDLIGMLAGAAAMSAAELRDRIANVRLAPSDIAIKNGCECIHFDFDGQAYFGALRGRNRDLCIDTGDPQSSANRAIAVRVLLDGNASKCEV